VLESLTVDENNHLIKLIIKHLKDPEFINGLLIVSFEKSSLEIDVDQKKNKTYPIS
jgi:hypothetical protein